MCSIENWYETSFKRKMEIHMHQEDDPWLLVRYLFAYGQITEMHSSGIKKLDKFYFTFEFWAHKNPFGPRNLNLQAQDLPYEILYKSPKPIPLLPR